MLFGFNESFAAILLTVLTFFEGVIAVEKIRDYIKHVRNNRKFYQHVYNNLDKLEVFLDFFNNFAHFLRVNK